MIKKKKVKKLARDLDIQENELPLTIKELKGRTSRRGVFLLELLEDKINEEDEHTKKIFNRTVKINDTEVSICHLLETNAIISELLSLVFDHGEEASQKYYQIIVKRLDPPYRFLIGYFLSFFDDFMEAIRYLHYLISYSLYKGGNPVENFGEIIEEFRTNKKSLVKLLQNPYDWINKAFKDDDDITIGIENMSAILYSEEGEIKGIKSLGDSIWDKFMDFPNSIYHLRKELISKYIFEFEFQPEPYFIKYNELPTPPVLFSPFASASGYVPAINESDISRIYPEGYFIIARRETEKGKDKLIAAAMVSAPGCVTSISYDIADMLLFGRFAYCKLIEKGEVYGPLVDHMYQEIFLEYYIATSN